MKSKYIVEYWDHDSDSAKAKGFDDYTKALEFEFKMKKKNAGNVQLKIRGKE